MNFTDARELVRLRHELRRLLVDRRTDQARSVLARLQALAASDAEEAVELTPELTRWQIRLDVLD